MQAPPDPLVSVQQTLELSSSPHTGGDSFQNPLPLQPEDVELPQAPPVFPCLETLSIIQKQDIAPSTTFPVSGDTTIPPVTPEVPQQFLRDPQESMTPERSNMPQIAAPSQPQTQQSQVSLFPEEGVALERAVRELQAGGNATLQQVLEAAVAQQQLNSVLYSPTPSADSLQQHVQENMNSLRLGTTDNSLSTQQQMQLQQQQHQMHQFQQHQQLQQHLEQQRQVLGTMQIQQQLILQPQDQLQQQQQQIIENMQQQQLQQNQQQQVLNNIQLQEQQQQNQLLNNLQHHQLQQQQQQQQNQALSNLQQQQQLQEQVLENLQQQFQAELLQPQMHSSSQVQQPVSLLQQAGELLTIQTSFPTQPPSHTSPPQQLFQSPRSLAESQGSQQRVQAALLQNTLTVLASGSLGSEQQAAGSTLYLSPNPQPQQQQQQQLAFISSIETSNQPQPVAIFQNQPQAQLSQMQQQGTPMEQQQSPQQNSQPPQLPISQQSTLFQSIPNHLQVANPGPQSQLSQPQQTGLLLCTTELNPQAIPQAILFSTQTQGPSPAGGLNVGIPQSEPAEPMSFQDQSLSHNNPASTENQQQNLFQEQQPMQVGPGSNSIPNSQPVELFLPQTSLTSLQNNIGSQEINSQPAASGTTIFVVQGGVGVVANPGQQPSDQLFQTNVAGNVAPQGQANLFVFSIQNGKATMIEHRQLCTSESFLASCQNQCLASCSIDFDVLILFSSQILPSCLIPPGLHCHLRTSPRTPVTCSPCWTSPCLKPPPRRRPPCTAAYRTAFRHKCSPV